MNASTPVAEKRQLPQNERMRALPRHFGVRFMMAAESGIYDLMKECRAEYRGGYWEFFEVSNGGFYMAPSPLDQKVRMYVAGNGYDGEMSNEAAGITACLMAYSRLSFKFDGKTDAFAEHFHSLRDFTASHPEASAIFAAID